MAILPHRSGVARLVMKVSCSGGARRSCRSCDDDGGDALELGACRVSTQAFTGGSLARRGRV